MRYDTVAVSREGPIAEIRLNRPDRGNPIDALFLAELAAASSAIHDDPTAHVVLLTAAGDGSFSSGRTPDAEPSDAAAASNELRFRCLELMAQPVIAVIQGDAIGAGLELALACDIRIAAEEAMLSLPGVPMGEMPSGGATQRLPRLVGHAKAAEMILLGEPVSAPAAVAWGLVNHIAPAAGLRALAERLAGVIASRGPLAVRYAKEAMLRGMDMPLEQALRYETDLTVILQTTADRAEGVQAFLE